MERRFLYKGELVTLEEFTSFWFAVNIEVVNEIYTSENIFLELNFESLENC